MRILKGYSKEERKELEEAKNNNYSSAMILIHGIGEEYSDCQALSEKYYHEDNNEDNQMAGDIVDYYAGVAKFPDKKKYYVHFIKGDSDSYLNYGLDSENYYTSDKEQISCVKTQFTKKEIRAINPRYMAFAMPVEDDDE